MEQHQFGLREWADLCERKDATIAALQARVQELEQAAKETHGRFISEQAAKKDVIDELTVALKSDADGQVLIDKLMQDVLKLESQLTQRTAELEAANKHCEIIEERKAEAYKEVEIQLLAKADLQAELERVRGTLQDAEAGYFVVERDLQGVNNRYDELRTLIAALPVVPSEYLTKEHIDVRVPVLQGTARFNISDELIALLQHRQGMEG